MRQSPVPLSLLFIIFSLIIVLTSAADSGLTFPNQMMVSDSGPRIENDGPFSPLVAKVQPKIWTFVPGLDDELHLDFYITRKNVGIDSPRFATMKSPLVFWEIRIIGPEPDDFPVRTWSGRLDFSDKSGESLVSKRRELAWDGTDEFGRLVADGHYRIEIAARTATEKTDRAKLQGHDYRTLPQAVKTVDALAYNARITVDSYSMETAKSRAIPAGYYDSVNDSTASTLRTTLHDAIDDHTWHPYSSDSTDTWDILNDAEEDPNNSANIIDVYRNASYPKSNPGLIWNREHTWPKSYGFKVESQDASDAAGNNYPYTDCHHLRASDTGYNSDRGNHPFEDCPSGCSEDATVLNDGIGGSGSPADSNWFSIAGDRWETWDQRKGDVARSIMYMAIRYEGGTHGITGYVEPDLEMTNNRGEIIMPGENEEEGKMGILDDILAWHEADPVDDRERNRNDAVYLYQGNRNPFVDHPEWVDCLWGTPQVCGCGITATATALPGSGCAGVAVQLDVTNISGGSGNYTYLWSPTAGLNNETLKNPTATVNTTTTYQVMITDTTQGCTAGPYGIEVVIVSPSIGTSASPDQICAGGSSQLQTTVSGGIGPFTYEWTGSGLSATDIANPIATPEGTGTVVYTVTVTDTGAGCSIGPVQQTIDVSAGTPPAQPTNVTALGSDEQVVVMWDNVLITGSYDIYRAGDSCGDSFSLVHSQIRADGTTNSWTDTSVTNGQNYCYRVIADNTICTSNFSDCGTSACAVPSTKPEVSGPTSSQPFILTKSGSSLEFKFAYHGTGYAYHLYGARTEAEIDGGNWYGKFCDLQSNSRGTWTTDGATWISFTISDVTELPDGLWVIVAEHNWSEGSYGHKSDGSARIKDSDRLTPVSPGCPGLAVPKVGDLVINELLTDPDDTNGDANNDGIAHYRDDEFAEIANVTNSVLVLDGLIIEDTLNDEGMVQTRHTFPAETNLFPCQSVIVFGGGIPTGDFSGALVQIATGGELDTGNDGDTINLRSSVGGTLLDSIEYGGTTGIPGDQNQSLNRSPEGTTDSIVLHTTLNPTLIFSPGTHADGSTNCWPPATAPSCDVTSPTSGTHSGDITIGFDATDHDSGTVTVTFEYSIDGLNFSAATPASGSSLTNPDDISPAAGYDFLWNSALDIALTESVTFRITVSDGVDDSICETTFDVNNDPTPHCNINSPTSGTLSGDVTVNFDAEDINNDLLEIDFEYATDGSTFVSAPATISSPLTNPAHNVNPATGLVFVWNSAAITTSESITFRITVDDGVNISTCQTTFTVNNGTGPGCCTDLFFSEYVEGSSYNKALEIYNGTGASIDLTAENYVIELYMNGNTSAGFTIPLYESGNLITSIADGDVFIVCHTSAHADIKAEKDIENGSLQFNGDDTLILKHDGEIIDVFGQLGHDPGTQWNVNGVETAEQTLRRKSSVHSGDTNPDDSFDPSAEWEEYPQDTFDGLDGHTVTCP